jgi:pimeloyl-ACP methyl ester carboxylesterase
MGKVVLIHGAWHGPWCWDAVVRELDARGVESVAVELPLTGYANDVAAAHDAIVKAGADSVVCGHSYGGMVISQAAAGTTGVRRLVYLTAFQTEPGEDPITLMQEDPSPLLTAIQVDERGLTVDPTRLHEVFYHDSDPSIAATIAPKLRPMPVGDTWASAEPAWKTVPSTYVVCSTDRAISPSVQRKMSKRATEVVEWPTDHSPFLTRPAAVADLLASYLE